MKGSPSIILCILLQLIFFWTVLYYSINSEVNACVSNKKIYASLYLQIHKMPFIFFPISFFSRAFWCVFFFDRFPWCKQTRKICFRLWGIFQNKRRLNSRVHCVCHTLHSLLVTVVHVFFHSFLSSHSFSLSLFFAVAACIFHLFMPESQQKKFPDLDDLSMHIHATYTFMYDTHLLNEAEKRRSGEFQR